jgi:hypothetical protein
MKRQLEDRNSAALQHITSRGAGGSTALEIGAAIARSWSVNRQRNMSRSDKEALGLATATRLAKAGLVVATRYNKFVLAGEER